MDYLAFCVAMISGLLGLQTSRLYQSSLTGKAFLSLSRYPALRIALTLAGYIALAGAIVLGFLMFPWWLVVGGWLVAGFLIALPALALRRNVERALTVDPVLHLVSALATCALAVFYFDVVDLGGGPNRLARELAWVYVRVTSETGVVVGLFMLVLGAAIWRRGR